MPPAHRRLRSILVLGCFSLLLLPGVARGATVTELVPASAPRGARLLVAGSGLAAPDVAVTFTGPGGAPVPAAIVERSDTFLEAVVPGDALTGNVRVTSGQTLAGTLSFTLAADPAFAKVATLAGDFREPAGTAAVLADGSAWVVDNARHQVRLLRADGTTAAVIGSGRGGFDDGSPATATFKAPTAIVLDPARGVLYVSDTGNHAIRQIALDGTVTTVAGTGQGGDVDGPASAARFRSPAGLAVNAAGTLYVADAGNHKIRVVANGVVTTLAGTGAEGEANGNARQSLFRGPEGVAVAPDGTIWVADSRNHRIRRIVNGIVSTVAGTGRGGHTDGAAATAELRDPGALLIDDSGNVIFADRANAAIRRLTISAAGMTVSTIAGSGNGFTDGVPQAARFHQPAGLAWTGALLVSDLRNGALRAIYQAPAAVAVHPRSGLAGGGNTIRLFGTGFVAGATSVRIGGVPASASYRSSTELLVVVPAASLGAADIEVTTPAGTVTLDGGYRYVEPPTVASISPRKGTTAAGQVVTIVGTNFEPDALVHLGAVSVDATFLSATSIRITTPALSAGAHDITVSTAGGSATLAGAFLAFPPPSIAGFTPVSGPAGTIVTITGSGFDSEAAGNSVRFGTFPAAITSATATELRAVVPAQFLSGPISVTTAGGTAVSVADFEIGTFTAVVVEPASISLLVGGTQQLAAYGVSADGPRQNLTSSVTWSTSRAAAATVEAGRVRGVAAGQATITATFGSLHGTADVTVTDASLPPDPATVAPEVDGSRSTGFAERIEFLYSGPAPIQTGVAPGTIDAARAVVVRGSVRARDGAALPGVRVSIDAHPELGSTLSRADGAFDLAVNGGTAMTVLFQRDGLISASREIATGWQDFLAVEPVVMIEYDPVVTEVQFGSAVTTAQVARGSAVSDEDGTRRPLLVIPAGTTATLKRADGTSVPVSTLSIRATEYTVGDAGPAAMPATLPPTSGYTYCVELSADEAVAAGATSVTFSRPLGYYVENFLGFPVGGKVPLGYFDRAQQIWAAAENGVIVRIVSVTNGLADVDTNGDGVAESAAALAFIGITEAERTAIAAAYPAGTSLWRLPIPHFTPWDANWPYGPPSDATPPNVPGAEMASEDVDDSACAAGSIIDCENQTLRQRIPIANTPFTLNYGSDRAPQRKSATLQIKLSNATYPASLTQIELEVYVAGRGFTTSFIPAPNLAYTYVWDGRDAYGRTVPGAAAAKVRIGYTYDAVYQEPAQFGRAFGALSGVPLTGNRARREITIWQESSSELVHWAYDARERGIGGFTLDIHHAYNSAGATLFRGDGARVSASGIGNILSNVAGSGCDVTTSTSCPPVLGIDGGRAATTPIRYPQHPALAPDGSLYIPEQTNNRVVRVTPTGRFEVVAGTGTAGYTGDGGPAKAAQLYQPRAVAIGKDGSLYIADNGNGVIRKVGLDGRIVTWAGFIGAGPGGGCQSGSGDVPLRSTSFCDPRGMAFGPDGSLFVADGSARVVHRIAPDGTARIYAGIFGTGCCSPYATPGIATQRIIGYPEDVAVARDGTVYITDLNHSRVHRVGTDGIMRVFAGTTNQNGGFGGDGGPSTQAQVKVPTGIDVDKDGNVYVGDHYNYRVRKIDGSGTISTVIGNGTFAYDGESGPPTAASLSTPVGVVVSPLGTIYVADQFNHRVRSSGKSLPGFGAGEFFVPSADGGEAYVFDSGGRHLRTIDPQFNAVIHTFGYDAAGRLATVTDHRNKTTVIERDASGNPTAIVSPHGVRTTLVTGGDGYLAALSGATGSYSFTYGDTGKMTKLVDARRNEHIFTYSPDGALIRDDRPTGSFKILTASGPRSARTVTLTTSGGKRTSYVRNRFADSSSQKASVDPSGRTRSLSVAVDRTGTVTTPDGTRVTTTLAPDPVLGMLVPFAESTVVATPGGRGFTLNLKREADLADAANPLSVRTRTNTLTVGSRVWTDTFSAAARTLTHRTPAGRVTVATFDSFGRRVSSQYAGTAAATYTYDGDGNLATVSRAGRVTTSHYNALGRLSSMTDALSRTMSFEYDDSGRIIQQTLPGGRAVSYTWDAAGNLTSIAPPSRPAYSFTYTASDLPETTQIPGEDGVTQFFYNADEQIESITRPDGTTVAYDYDSGGRLSAIITPSGRFTTAYGAAGVVSSVSSPDGVTTDYVYDGPLMLSETWSGAIAGSIVRTYGADTRMASENGVTFGYDADDLLMQAGALTLQRDATTGVLTGSTLGSTTDAWGFNAFGEISSYSAAYAGTAVFGFDLTRDGGGRVRQKTETLAGVRSTTVYEYDAAGRLEKVTRDNVDVTAYAYDENGNRQTRTASGNTESGVYDDRDRVQTYGGAMFTHDAAGRIESRTDANGTTTYGYDAVGNLRQAVLPGGRVVSYVVDGRKRRVGRRVDGTLTHGWLYLDQYRIGAELDPTGAVVSRFVYASRQNVPDYMIRGGKTYRILSDHLGSPRVVIDVATGAFVQMMGYDELGNVLSDSNPGFQPFGFAGGLYDPETRLVRFGARDYDARMGRWTTMEPLGFAAGETNLYTYAAGDPVNLIDPDGRKVYPANFVGPLQPGDSRSYAANLSDPRLVPLQYPTYGTAPQFYYPPGTPVDLQDECVSFTKTFAGVPCTSCWREGPKVMGNTIPPGTAIATFVKGRYPQGDVPKNSGIYLSPTPDGFVILDQWGPDHKAQARPLSPGGDTRSNDANGYSVILAPAGECGCSTRR